MSQCSVCYKTLDFILGMPTEKEIRQDYTASTRSTLLGILTQCRGNPAILKQFEREATERWQCPEGQSVPALRGYFQSTGIKGGSEKALE